MFNINDSIEMPETFTRITSYTDRPCLFLSNRLNSFTLQEAFIHQCWNSRHIDVIYWLHDEYGMDLTINESPNYLDDTNDQERRVSLMTRMLYSFNDNSIHDINHKGYLLRFHEDDGTILKNIDNWMNNRFCQLIEVFTYMADKYPTLKFEMIMGDDRDVHNNIYDFIKEVLLSEPLGSEKYGQVESATEFLNFFDKYDTTEKENFSENMEYFIGNL